MLWLVVLPVFLGVVLQNNIEPIKFQSLKAACVARLEELILSGELKIGERLPSERDFATRIGVSRPVLHEALVDLDTKGLVQIIPRRGTFVSDYRRSGSLSILSSLLVYRDGKLDPLFIQSLIDMRLVVETETARLAAINRTSEQMDEFHTMLDQERQLLSNDPQKLTDLDFFFHLSIAIASGNLVFPLLINSFKDVYTNLTGEFFRKYYGTPVIEIVRQFHVQLVDAFVNQDAEKAKSTMILMLRHGEAYLKGDLA
jgi:GntR family transcriptional regulator, transcriptional repressor for pyruvate dehydrogenase complex